MEQNKTIGRERILEWMEVLRGYHAGLARTKGRIIASENWWKLRNAAEEARYTAIGRDGGFTAQSGCTEYGLGADFKCLRFRHTVFDRRACHCVNEHICKSG